MNKELRSGKTFTTALDIEIKREVEDSLGLSEESYSSLQRLLMEALKPILQTCIEQNYLPRRIQVFGGIVCKAIKQEEENIIEISQVIEVPEEIKGI